MVFLEKIFGKRSSSVDNDIVSYEKTELEKLLLRRIVELRVDEAVVIEFICVMHSVVGCLNAVSDGDFAFLF